MKAVNALSMLPQLEDDAVNPPQVDRAEGADALAMRNPPTPCIAVVPEPAFNTPSLRKGESTSYQVCFDVPAKNIEGGRIVIVDLADFGGEGVAWAVE